MSVIPTSYCAVFATDSTDAPGFHLLMASLKISRLASLWLLLLFSDQLLAVVETGINAETRLKNWKLSEGALSLELIQRLPDQTRAFFQARGFPRAIADDIGTQCVFQAIGKNTAAKIQGHSVSYDLHDWRLLVDGNARGIKLKQKWDIEWADSDISKAARVAFRWATFPTQQNFEAGGDYNWGMISFGLPPGSVFDLQLVWEQDSIVKTRWIKQIECPADR